MLIASAVLVTGCLNSETAVTTDTESSSAATGSTSGTDGTAGPSTGSSSDVPTEASTSIPTTGEPSTGEPSTGEPSTGVDSTGTPAAVCGDSVVEAPESCDDGDRDDADECPTSCQPAFCGDGFVQAGVEACDDGNKVNADACSNKCVPTPIALMLAPGGLTKQYGDTQAGLPFLDTCPQGQVLIGFSGVLKLGSHAAIKGLCGTPALAVQGDAFVVTVAPGATLSERGGAGDTPWMRSCQANTVVSGFSGRAAAGLNQLTLSCAPLVISEAIDGSFSVSLGMASALPAIGGPGGLPFLQTDCPAGQVGAAQNLRANAAIAAFGLGCVAVSLTD